MLAIDQKIFNSASLCNRTKTKKIKLHRADRRSEAIVWWWWRRRRRRRRLFLFKKFIRKKYNGNRRRRSSIYIFYIQMSECHMLNAHDYKYDHWSLITTNHFDSSEIRLEFTKLLHASIGFSLSHSFSSRYGSLTNESKSYFISNDRYMLRFGLATATDA